MIDVADLLGRVVTFAVKFVKCIPDVLLGVICTAFGLSFHPVVVAAICGAAYYYNMPHLLWALLPVVLGFVAVVFSNRATGRLPSWAAIWETPDEPLPGDKLEPVVARVFNKYGYFICSLYWVLVRNRGFGLAFMLGRYLPDGKYLDGDKWGFQLLDNGAWRLVINLYICQVGIGTQTTIKKGVGLYAIPWATLKRVKNGKP